MILYCYVLPPDQNKHRVQCSVFQEAFSIQDLKTFKREEYYQNQPLGGVHYHIFATTVILETLLQLLDILITLLNYNAFAYYIYHDILTCTLDI